MNSVSYSVKMRYPFNIIIEIFIIEIKPISVMINTAYGKDHALWNQIVRKESGAKKHFET